MRHKRRQVHTTPTVLLVDTVAPEVTSQDIPALPPTAVTAAEAESKAARTGGDGTAKTLQSKENPSLSVTNYPILWWTPPLPPTSQEEEEKEAEASLPYTLDTCGLDYRCTFTADRSLLLTSNVILFRGSQLEEQDLPPASERPSSQAWVLNTVLEDTEEVHRKEAITSVLDPTHIWSHSFQTADFIETVFQSRRPLSNSTQKQQQRQQRQSFVNIVTMPPRVDLQEKNRLRRLGKENGGRASAVWISTTEGGGCVDAPSGRENYVRELVMVMDVDIYGPCMNNSVWPVHPGTQKPYTTQEIMAEYKFVFALERVNCQDYITSHVADALTVGAVPIVDGQPLDYSRFSPTENAFLQISEFLAPELLAQEVDRLDRNDTLYLERLIYRGRGGKEVDEMVEGEGAVAAALSPLFKQTFGGADSELAMSATSSATSSVSPSTRTWPPDRHGIYCGICQLAHSLAQDTYDWTAHSQQRDAITNRTLSLAATTPTCEPSPRYLPGLPIQMQAYDAYLQVQNEIAFDRQQEEMEDLLRQEQEVDNGSVLGPSTMAHVVNVTVSFDDNTNTNTGFNVSDTSGGGGATKQSLLENKTNFISQPSIVVLHQDVSTSSSSLSKAQEHSGLDPATTHHHILDDNTLTSSASADDGTTLPLSEVHYLLLLIMAMFVGVGALVLILSKSARHKLFFWPWRHLFYKKLPRDDLNIDALTLERVMLQELGEDLLYD